MIKVSDYIVKYLTEQNIDKAFVIQGGAVAHIIDSIAKNPKIKYITCQHEQACAMAADAYSRVSHKLGVAIATSGPGATNLITGIANAYYDSIPTIFITGNVASFRQSDLMNVRQYGFQETNIVKIVESITKYSVRIDNPYNIKAELDKAFYIANSNRKGPVLIDIPDDFQRTFIDEKKLTKNYKHKEKRKKVSINFDKILYLLKNAKRPVLVFGNGILSSKSENLAVKLSEKLNIPTLYSWPLKGIFDYSHKLNYGSFGTNSLRYGNFIIQNSDLIISIGHRLDTHATGSIKDFARESKIIMIDIDENELQKFQKLGKKIDLSICTEAHSFLKQSLKKIDFIFKDKKWLTYCNTIKKKYSKIPLSNYKFVSPYKFFNQLSKLCKKRTIFTGDTGANLVYLFNNLEEKKDQKFISAFNNTPMGYSLPASIGAALSSTKSKIICCIGDGGMQMNIQELATIKYYKLPITIIVFNNYGHGMIKQTQDDWFNSKYHASSSTKGLPKLNFSKIAKAYGIKSFRIKSDRELDLLSKNFKTKAPLLIEVILDEELRVEPMLQYGRPIEDANPLINRNDFLNSMIIEPLEISKELK